MIFNRTINLRDLVATKIQDEIIIHLPEVTGAGYDTLCGLDTSEPESARVTLPRGARVTCPTCIRTWYECKTIPASFVDARALALKAHND